MFNNQLDYRRFGASGGRALIIMNLRPGTNYINSSLFCNMSVSCLWESCNCKHVNRGNRRQNRMNHQYIILCMWDHHIWYQRHHSPNSPQKWYSLLLLLHRLARRERWEGRLPCWCWCYRLHDLILTQVFEKFCLLNQSSWSCSWQGYVIFKPQNIFFYASKHGGARTEGSSNLATPIGEKWRWNTPRKYKEGF